MKNEDDGLLSLLEFKKFLYDHVVPVEDIRDLSGEPILKIIPFWRKKNLLPFLPVGMHFKISFAQLIWIRILDHLRHLGYPLREMQKITDYFFKDAYEEHLPKKIMLKNKQYFLKLKATGTLTQEGEWLLENIENFLKSEPVLSILKWDINYLTLLINDCLGTGGDILILIYHDGRAGEYRYVSEELTSHRSYILSKDEPHIQISVKYLLMEFIQHKELSQLFLPILLNEDEKRVLQELKNKNVRQITVTMQNGKVENIESTKTGIIKGSDANKIKEILGLRNYERILLDTVDEKTLSFRKTKKKL